MNERPLARVIVARLERSQQQFRLVLFCLDHNPSAQRIVAVKMRVIVGASRQALAAGEQLIEQVPTIAPIGADGASMIVDFDGMRTPDAVRVGDCKSGPRRMSECDKGAGVGATLRQSGGQLALRSRREVKRKADRQNVPELAKAGLRRVHLGAEKGCERSCPIATRIDDGKLVSSQKVIGKREKIVTGVAVDGAHALSVPRAIRSVRMCVQIALEEAAGRREGAHTIGFLSINMCFHKYGLPWGYFRPCRSTISVLPVRIRPRWD